MLITTISDFLVFLANSNAVIGVLALIAWVLIVGAVVWLTEKAVEKFRQRLRTTATQAETAPPLEAIPRKPASEAGPLEQPAPLRLPIER
jgi:hypothetical protein